MHHIIPFHALVYIMFPLTLCEQSVTIWGRGRPENYKLVSSLSRKCSSVQTTTIEVAHIM